MAAVVIELSGDEAKLLKAYQKVRDSQDKMDRSLKKVKDSSDKAGQAGEQAGSKFERSFGRGAITKLQGYATGLLGIHTAVQTITAAMQEAQAATDGAVGAVNRLAQSRMRLLQVQQGPKDRQHMEDIADLLASDTGISREEARELVFSARSEGFEGARSMVAKLSGAGVLSIQAAATAAGQVPTLFPGQGLTSEQSLNAAFIAAQKSRVSFEQLSRAMPIAAEGTNMIGTSPAESMALSSVLSARFKSPETAGDRIKAIAGEINMYEDMRGRGVLAIVDELEAGSDERRSKFLKSNKEVIAAYQTIVQERNLLGARTKDIQEAIDLTGTSQAPLALAERVAFDQSTPAGRLNAMRAEKNKADVRLEIAREQALASRGFSAAIAQTTMQQRLTNERSNFLQKYAANKGMTAATESGMGGNIVSLAGIVAGAAATPIMNSPLGLLFSSGERIERAAQSLERAADNLDSSAEQNARQRAAADRVPE